MFPKGLMVAVVLAGCGVASQSQVKGGGEGPGLWTQFYIVTEGLEAAGIECKHDHGESDSSADYPVTDFYKCKGLGTELELVGIRDYGSADEYLADLRFTGVSLSALVGYLRNGGLSCSGTASQQSCRTNDGGTAVLTSVGSNTTTVTSESTLN